MEARSWPSGGAAELRLRRRDHSLPLSLRLAKDTYLDVTRSGLPGVEQQGMVGVDAAAKRPWP